MAGDDPYCAVGDLLTGDVPLPDYLNPSKFVADAADEIDSKIGFLYETRVDISLGTTVAKPVCLLLKRLNVFLATGRLLMAAAAGKEEKQAYAKSLIDDAESALTMIAKGEIPLLGATPVAREAAPVVGPRISNGDNESAVDAFYDRVVNPDYLHPRVVEFWPRYVPKGGFVR